MGRLAKKFETPLDADRTPLPEGACAIPLTRGKMAIIDLEDYFRVRGSSWCFSTGYAQSRIKRAIVLLHRLIMDAPDGMEVDHKNMNRLDCRKQNLRIVTSSQNKFNCIKRRVGNFSSKYVGVYFMNRYRKWVAGICKDGKETYIGRFDSEEDAVRARDEVAKRMFGEYARLNFPLEG